MLAPEQKKALVAKLNELKKAIHSLRNELNAVDQEKETLFDQKEKYAAEIQQKVSLLRKSRDIRNTLTKQVKTDKEERSRLREEVREGISRFKELRKKKAEILKKLGLEKDPSKIQLEIEQLEFKFETQPMAFDKETQLRKKIREMKKQIEEARVTQSIQEDMQKTIYQLDEKRKKAEIAHQRIQDNARLSQQKHEQILALSKMLDEIRPKEEETFKKFLEAKKKFNGINTALKEKLIELSGIRQEMEKHRMETKRFFEEREEAELKKLETAVEEKIRKGKKITTEDLLVFQQQVGKG